MEGVRVTDTTPVVVEAVRTPMAKESGVFADIRSEDLSLPLVNDILVSTSLTGEDVDDLMWGCAKQCEEQGNNLARKVWLSNSNGNLRELLAVAADAFLCDTDSYRGYIDISA